MPIKLTTSDESTLLLSFAEQLQNAKVRNILGAYIPRNEYTNVLPQVSEPLRLTLERHLDHGDLRQFLGTELTHEFLGLGHKLPSGKGAALSDFKEYKDPLKAARRMVDRLKGLPYQYRLVVSASQALSSAVFSTGRPVDIKISEQLKLCDFSSLDERGFLYFKSDNPVDKYIVGTNFEASSLDPSPDIESLYFVYRTSGYAQSRRESRLIRDFADELRAFYGLCIVGGILDNYSFTFEEKPIFISAQELSDEKEELADLERLESDLTKASYLEVSDHTDGMISANVDLSSLLEFVVSAFASEESAKFKTAAIWLLRAHLSQRGMDKVLESTIAIEVLLGDRETSDRIGLSKLMANRCAYSLGKTVAERQEIMEFFVKFYKVRSEIVHSGRLNLSAGELDVVGRGLNLASRLLMNESTLAS